MSPGHEREGHIINNMVTVCFDPKLTSAGADFAEEAAAVLKHVKERPLDGRSVIAPGERAELRRSEREEWLEIERDTWRDV